MNRISIIVLLLTSIIAASCSKKLRISDIADPENLESLDFNFDQLDTRARIRYNDGDQRVALNASIRMKKDSVIWISLSPILGIEVARGLITPDSVMFMDRINQEYMIYDYGALSRKFNFNLNFQLIQSLLIGDIPWKAGLNDRIRRYNDQYVLRQEFGRIFVENFINPKSMKVEKIHISEQATRNDLTFEFKNFQVLQRKIFPYSSSIILNYYNNEREYTTSINIDHNKIEVDGETILSFPFIVPDRYARK